MNYYNDNDPHIAVWLKELINAKLIPNGDVDTRSISDVTAGDVRGYTQCHFFAGIGGWSYALQLAGWPLGRPIWSGSAPCQPFSVAGKQLGTKDERHLWPEFFRLISECRPPVVFGEQVKGAINHGWLDELCLDLEGQDYAVGATVLGAHSVGADHIRQRLFWVASNSNKHHQDRRSSFMQVRWLRGKEASPQNIQRKGNQWAIKPRPMAVAYGVPKRVELLNGYGNSIVPQVAAEFIKAYLAI